MNENLKEKWHQHFLKFNESNLSIKEFCIKNDLIKSQFYYWKSRIPIRLAAPKKISKSNFLSFSEKAKKELITFKIGDHQISFSSLPDAIWMAKFIKEVQYGSSKA